MKNLLLLTIVVISTVFLTACNEAPLTQDDQAKKYGLTTKEYQEMKEASARMGMTVEDHMKTMGQ